MSRPTDYHTLINRGRKAGLNARELYAAMAGQSLEQCGTASGQADCNGFVSAHNDQGQRVYRPAGRRP
jgi:hypothetical protein